MKSRIICMCARVLNFAYALTSGETRRCSRPPLRPPPAWALPPRSEVPQWRRPRRRARRCPPTRRRRRRRARPRSTRPWSRPTSSATSEGESNHSRTVCPSWCGIDVFFHPTLQFDRGGADAEAGCGPRLRRGAACPHAQHSRGGGAEARVLGGKLLGKWEEPIMVGYCRRCRHIVLVNTEFLITVLSAR